MNNSHCCESVRDNQRVQHYLEGVCRRLKVKKQQLGIIVRPFAVAAKLKAGLHENKSFKNQMPGGSLAASLAI